MNDDRLKQVLLQADRLAGTARPVPVDVGAIRQRAGARRTIRRIGFGAVAVAATVGICIGLGLSSERRRPQPTQPPPTAVADSRRVVQLEAEVRELRASTDRALALLQEVAQQRDRDRRLDELKRELAGIPDPMDQVRVQVSQAAERMVREADQLWLGQRQRRPAMARYQRVIELFPDNEWASVARQRLSQITGTQSKGDSI